MLVSDLLKFRDDFYERVSSLALDRSIADSCRELTSIVSSNTSIIEFVAHTKIQNAVNQIQNFNTEYDQIKNQLMTAMDDIYQQIDLLSSTINTGIDTPYKRQFKVADNPIYNEFHISPDISQIIKSKIHQTSDWHYPGMQLGCRNASYTSDLISCDPLYLCDFNLKYIENVSNQFNDIYSRRLRKYLIADHQLGQMPQNQFGLIFSWMFLNFVDITDIQLYLSESIKILRPGGVFMFSYNNGDMIESARLFESGIMSFIPKRKLIPICKNLGFEIVNSFDFTNVDDNIKTISWIELRKPGELSTVKRSQAQGLVGRK
jgi:hypothetical protein